MVYSTYFLNQKDSALLLYQVIKTLIYNKGLRVFQTTMQILEK